MVINIVLDCMNFHAYSIYTPSKLWQQFFNAFFSAGNDNEKNDY